MRHPVQIPIRLSVLVHTKVVSHLVGDDEHRLKVVSLVDRARVVGMAHSGDPRQPNHTGKVFFLSFEPVVSFDKDFVLGPSFGHSFECKWFVYNMISQEKFCQSKRINLN